MSMLSLSSPVLLVRMRIGNMMSDADLLKERIKFFILSTLVSLHGKDFLIKLTLNKSLEFLKFLKHF
jgi:hypothetical protein